MAEPLNNPGGAFGVTDLAQKTWSREVVMKASAAIAAKTVVQLNVDGTNTIITAPVSPTKPLCIGITKDAIAAGGVGLVVIGGYIGSVPMTGAYAAAGVVIQPSSATAGSVATGGATGDSIGVGLTAVSGGLVDVWVRPS